MKNETLKTHRISISSSLKTGGGVHLLGYVFLLGIILIASVIKQDMLTGKIVMSVPQKGRKGTMRNRMNGICGQHHLAQEYPCF